ncbi:MAG: GDP-mannose 4,6-dehydratase [Lachnospiraceae bacterium]|nr:GDP-mannose 4,6-dehydratase [Lachnospiraceae bacterium]
MMRKKILITGITGFAGSHLMDYLLEHTDYEVYGIKRVNSSLRNIHHALDRITLFDADLLDETSLIKVLREACPDQIYHLGALSWVTPSWNMPAVYMQTNAVGTINLFEAMRVTGCSARVLTSATPEEFGDVPKELLPITEETRIRPINPYAASKVAQDMVCITYHASYGMDIVRTRAFNHEGARRDKHGAIASFAYQIARIEQGLQEPVIKVGNLSATRNFTDVRDTVRAYYLAMEKGVSGELYLIGTDQIYTMEQVLHMLIAASVKADEIKVEVDPARVRPTELMTFIGDYSKFKSMSGWEIQYPLQETLTSVLEYWREFVSKGLY